MKTFRLFKIKKYKPLKFKVRKQPTYKPIKYKKPKPFKFKRGRWLKNGTIQHMKVTASGRRYWTPKLIKHNLTI
jgi:hypothetical protein|tara:strand:- start:199 stop:420 length:222 start_codon:yes stop_codon:yes gene_type:complete